MPALVCLLHLIVNVDAEIPFYLCCVVDVMLKRNAQCYFWCLLENMSTQIKMLEMFVAVSSAVFSLFHECIEWNTGIEECG